ncbi:MAG: MOSC domain-containing protein, partial [Candidatus Heimdallarchaeota archaeon]|nr:MOSC domain-containing protein [Candidatus Heimdallarchaeota archaeon]
MAFVKQVNVRPISESADIGKVGLPKMSVLEAKVTKQGVGDDYNHYRFVAKKNTPNRAVLIFTTDILEQLNNEGWPVNAGDLGENITIEGLAYAKIAVGTKISVGEITIEVTEKADPC